MHCKTIVQTPASLVLPFPATHAPRLQLDLHRDPCKPFLQLAIVFLTHEFLHTSVLLISADGFLYEYVQLCRHADCAMEFCPAIMPACSVGTYLVLCPAPFHARARD